MNPTIRKAVLERDGKKCVSCSAVDWLEVDHITPRHYGGSDDKSNLQTICVDCNRKKNKWLVDARSTAFKQSKLKIECHCQRCNYKWNARQSNPKECPACKSRKWDEK